MRRDDPPPFRDADPRLALPPRLRDAIATELRVGGRGIAAVGGDDIYPALMITGPGGQSEQEPLAQHAKHAPLAVDALRDAKSTAMEQNWFV